MFLGNSADIKRVFRKAVNDAQRGTSAPAIAEKPPSYAAEYPYNNVKATESGHLFEMDDTPGAERMHLYHRSGTHVEMQPDGMMKIVSKSKRQDVTIADQEIIVNGDYKISIAGGSNIYVRNGVFEIQADNGLAINVKGELKLKGDNIFMRADNKISLAAPRVDIGGIGKNINVPFLSLPTGIVPIFGVLVPRVTGIFPAGSQVPQIPSSSVDTSELSPTTSLTGLISIVKSMGSTLKTLTESTTEIPKYARNAGLSLTLAKSLKDAKGMPLLPEVEQPEEIPLSNPKVYNGISEERVAFRDRQFDTPEDVENSTSYIAHQNLCEQLRDFTSDLKDLSGQPSTQYTDLTPPTEEPPPWTAYPFSAGGTVTFQQGNTVVIGTGTTFTEDIVPNMYMTFSNAPFNLLEFPQSFPKVVSVVNNTVLIINEPYGFTTVSGVTPYVFKYRPFREYADKKIFAMSDSLGSSGLTLQNLMVNFLTPILEREEFAIPQDVVVPPTTGSGPTPTPPPVPTPTPIPQPPPGPQPA